jgi:hypothetical protein
MPGVPPFTRIAQSSNINGDSLAHLLESPDPKMGKLAHSRAALDDIAAYIVSLKNKPK